MPWTQDCTNCHTPVNVGAPTGDWLYVERATPLPEAYCDPECLAAHLQQGYLPPEDRLDRTWT